MYNIEQKPSDIDKLLNRCCEVEDSGKSEAPGQSYESGIKAGIEWLTTKGASYPLD